MTQKADLSVVKNKVKRSKFSLKKRQVFWNTCRVIFTEYTILAHKEY